MTAMHLRAIILRAKYYPGGDIFQVTFGLRLSFTWQSICDVRNVIAKGSSWLIGDDSTLKVWESRWFP